MATMNAAFAPMPFDANDAVQVSSMPHNLEAEQALLGSLMFDNAVFERLSDRLRGSHFYEPFHQRPPLVQSWKHGTGGTSGLHRAA
jgi:replicative DNA helicase